MGQASYHWQTDGVYDAEHQLVHVMGKPANCNPCWYHAVYNITTDTWTPAVNLGWNSPGHIYGNLAYDPATGDLFQSVAYKKYYRYNKATNNWAPLPVNYNGDMNSINNGIAWHPNLYGPGDGGLIIGDQFRLLFWRKSTNTVQDVYMGYNTLGQNGCEAVYFAAIDKVINGGPNHALISPNGGNLPDVEVVGAPPIKTGGYAPEYDLPYGVLTLHPGDSSKMLLLQRLGSRRVWETTDGDNWTRTSYNHPFDIASLVVVTIPDHGVIWAIGNDMGDPFSKLWKPDDMTTKAESTLARRPSELSAFPNPFNSAVAISLPTAGGLSQITAAVYDVRGRIVADLSRQAKNGRTITWNAKGFPKGVYLLKVSAGLKTITKKLFLQK
jgi:hypothetical protein